MTGELLCDHCKRDITNDEMIFHVKENGLKSIECESCFRRPTKELESRYNTQEKRLYAQATLAFCVCANDLDKLKEDPETSSVDRERLQRAWHGVVEAMKAYQSEVLGIKV